MLSFKLFSLLLLLFVNQCVTYLPHIICCIIHICNVNFVIKLTIVSSFYCNSLVDCVSVISLTFSLCGYLHIIHIIFLRVILVNCKSTHFKQSQNSIKLSICHVISRFNLVLWVGTHFTLLLYCAINGCWVSCVVLNISSCCKVLYIR